MAETFRAFIAVDLPDRVRGELGDLQRDLKSKGLKIRWVKPACIHLTLRFLGEIPEDLPPEIGGLMTEAAVRFPPFSLTAKGMGVFPSLRRARVLWVGLSGDMETLVTMHQRLSRLLETVGFPMEGRPFRPHLTLGRIKQRLDPKRLAAAISSQADFFSEPFTVREITLFKSRLAPQGAVYTPLFKAPFNQQG